MTTNKATKAQETPLRPKSDRDDETTWAPDGPVTAPENYTEAIFQKDLEMASRRITNEIDMDPKAVAKLRREAREGKTRSRSITV